MPCWVASTLDLCKVCYAARQDKKQFVPTPQTSKVEVTPLSRERRSRKLVYQVLFMAWMVKLLPGFHSPVQSPLPGNCRVTLLEELWEHWHEHGHTTVYTSHLLHQTLFDANLPYPPTVDHDVITVLSTNKITIRVYLDIHRKIRLAAPTARLTPWARSGGKTHFTHERASLNKQK